ncbi:MAG: protein kinase [Pseudolysinimonas sp.]
MTNERTVAGHRILRLLAVGERSRVWLAADGIVLKVLTPPVPIEQPGAEAEALHRARGEHVVELLDFAVGVDGAVLVFPRLARGSLSDLLSVRSALDAGEAVTILAPIATCLARLHAAGVAHGALSTRSVLFTADGAPTLAGFGGAQIFDAGLAEVALERVSGVAADRAALRGLTDVVLARTGGSRGKVAAALRERLRALPDGSADDGLISELFELAAPRPVRFEADPADGGDPAGRAVAVTEPVAADSAEPGMPGARDRMMRILDAGPGSVVRAAVRDRWTGWSGRRRRAMLAAGAGGLVVVVALVVIPAPGTPSVPTPAVPAVESPGPADGSGAEEADGPIAGDDPIAALAELFARRERCFRELSVLCLDGVDEGGSAASEADREALRAMLEGGDAPPSLHLATATLTERLGGSALVELGPDSDPASVLLMKGEAGWRIRDYLAPLGDGGTVGG